MVYSEIRLIQSYQSMIIYNVSQLHSTHILFEKYHKNICNYSLKIEYEVDHVNKSCLYTASIKKKFAQIENFVFKHSRFMIQPFRRVFEQKRSLILSSLSNNIYWFLYLFESKRINVEQFFNEVKIHYMCRGIENALSVQEIYNTMKKHIGEKHPLLQKFKERYIIHHAEHTHSEKTLEEPLDLSISSSRSLNIPFGQYAPKSYENHSKLHSLDDLDSISTDSFEIIQRDDEDIDIDKNYIVFLHPLNIIKDWYEN